MASPGLQGLSGLLKELPTILFLSDIMFYVFGSLFYGSIVMRGFRGYMNPLVHFGLRVAMGFLSMIGGLAFRGFFPQFNEGIYQLFRLDILIGSLLTSVLLAIGIYLMTFRLINIDSLIRRIEKLEKIIDRAKKGRKKKQGFNDPVVWIGVGIIVGTLAFSLFSFQGLPSISEGFLSFAGFTQDDLRDLSNEIGKFEEQEKNLPEDCTSILNILQATGPDITKLPRSTDSRFKSLIERGAGSNVIDMRVASVAGEAYIIAVTDDTKLCSAKSDKFCSCLDMSNFTI